GGSGTGLNRGWFSSFICGRHCHRLPGGTDNLSHCSGHRVGGRGIGSGHEQCPCSKSLNHPIRAFIRCSGDSPTAQIRRVSNNRDPLCTGRSHCLWNGSQHRPIHGHRSRFGSGCGQLHSFFRHGDPGRHFAAPVGKTGGNTPGGGAHNGDLGCHVLPGHSFHVHRSLQGTRHTGLAAGGSQSPDCHGPGALLSATPGTHHDRHDNRSPYGCHRRDLRHCGPSRL
ncbi:uncharacterized protein METZ01_LOCUS434540, partial [marine metagenome]